MRSPRQRFRSSLERNRAAREGTDSASTVSTLCLTATSVLVLLVPLVLRAANAGMAQAPENPIYAGGAPVPRYALIDFGTNFAPAGINNSNIVVGNIGPMTNGGSGGQGAAIWSWSSNSSQALPVNSTYEFPANFYYVVGIDDAGRIAGNIEGGWIQIPNDHISTHESYTGLGCFWASTSSTPVVLGEGESSVNGNFDLLDTRVTAISDQGTIIGNGCYSTGYANFGPGHVESFNPGWNNNGTNDAHILYPPDPWPATDYGAPPSADTNCYANGSGGATNWCGNESTYTHYPFFGPNYPVIDGIAYTSSAYTNLGLSAINDTNIAVGSVLTNSIYTAVMVKPLSGTTLSVTTLGPGTASYLNNQTNASGAPAPQIIGGDTNNIPMLWDQTTPSGSPAIKPLTGNYVGKTLTSLLNNTNNWSMTSVSGINNLSSIIGTATYTPTGPTDPIPAGVHGVYLCPLELDLVNRDVLTQTWTNEVPGGLVTVYSGTTTGDMVNWKLKCPSAWESGTFTWTATDSQGNVITGPTGVGVDHWQIANTGGNDPSGNTTLTWKPDSYAIKCNIAVSGGVTIPIKFTQKVGWRTEDYVVIGQIVNTITFQNSGPATLTDSTLFRGAVATDCIASYTLGSGLASLAGLSPSALPDSAFGFIEFGSWGNWPHSLTPQGPLWYAGAVTEGDRYWMLENALNASVDTPTVASQLTAAQMASAQSAGQYRIFQHYQTRFTLTSAGKIDTTSFHDIHNDGIPGPTKFNIPAGTFNPAWNNPDIPLFSLPSEANQIDAVLNQGHTQISTDGTKHSSYSSVRIGSDGQNVNWHIFGQDVPWVYSEIICSVASNHTVTSSIKMSVDKTWQDSGGVSGNTNFNNLNIYKATTSADVSGAVSVNYVWQHDSPLLMEGQLQSFILSVPLGTWPTPPTTPSVQ